MASASVRDSAHHKASKPVLIVSMRKYTRDPRIARAVVSNGQSRSAQILHGKIMSADIAGVSGPKKAKCESILIRIVCRGGYPPYRLEFIRGANPC